MYVYYGVMEEETVAVMDGIFIDMYIRIHPSILNLPD